MSQFATLPRLERGDLLVEAGNRTRLAPLILEKDFWVVWCLARLFDDATLGEQILFKGGTSLAKVFRVIHRFSEDVDLGVHPSVLGFSEQDLVNATSRTQRNQRHASLQKACGEWVRSLLQPRLEATMLAVLGPRPQGDWLEFVSEPGKSPELHFWYPSAVDGIDGYITKRVNLELGSLTDQRPTGSHAIEAILAEPLRALDLQDTRATVVALEIEKTFWEKATILHAEFHRPAEKPMPSRYARHYVDFAALWLHPLHTRALERIDLLAEVARHKQLFFASGWANYATATPGTLRLSPPEHRRQELVEDFEKMQQMFLGTPPDFATVLAAIAAAEGAINVP